MPPRYTIRMIVGTYRRKVFGTLNEDGSPRRPPYPAAAALAFYGMLELAEEQPTRGRFESEKLLRLLLEGPDGRGKAIARQVSFLIAQGDLIREGRALLVEGWDILQEGDTTIADRVARFRTRKRAEANGSVTPDVTAHVTPGVTENPRTGDARGSRRARNAVATVDGFGDGSGSGSRVRAGGPTSIGQVLEPIKAAAAAQASRGERR